MRWLFGDYRVEREKQDISSYTTIALCYFSTLLMHSATSYCCCHQPMDKNYISSERVKAF